MHSQRKVRQLAPAELEYVPWLHTMQEVDAASNDRVVVRQCGKFEAPIRLS